MAVLHQPYPIALKPGKSGFITGKEFIGCGIQFFVAMLVCQSKKLCETVRRFAVNDMLPT